MDKVILEAKNINYSYPDNKEQGIYNIHFQIHSGEVILLTGASGSGKSTLLKCLNGLIPHLLEGELQGELLIHNSNTKTLRMASINEKIGSVFQNPRSQFFTDNALSEMVFAMENYGLPREEMQVRVDTLSEEFGLSKILGRNIFELSSGERQLLALASAKTLNQNIMLLDEPSANLDYGNSMLLSKIIAKMKANGVCVIVADHRFFYLKGLLDRVFLMDKGQLEIFDSEQDFCNSSYAGRGFSIFDTPLPQKTPASFSTTVLEAKNLYYSNIIKNLSFTLKQGEVTLLLGNNGCGKSTLAKLLCNSIKPKQGKIIQKDLPLYIMQDADYQLFGTSAKQELSIADHPVPEAKIEEVLTNLNLYAFKDCHPFSLSGGQKQRLQIGMCLLSEKNLLILDEPTSGLDLQSMNQVTGELGKLKEKSTILVISHDYEFICKVADRILYLKDGKIEKDFYLNEDSLPQLKEIFMDMEQSYAKHIPQKECKVS